VVARIETSDFKILVRRRKEKDSLYGQDLSGKWELPGGGVEIFDFDEGDYQSAISSTLDRELMEEAGLEIDYDGLVLNLLPAWLGKDGLIDLAFMIEIPVHMVRKTPTFEKMMDNNEIRFVTIEEARKIEFVSKRMKFLALYGFL
jgi:8-oxo-dGTP pyrophosphatase MutT (NUDIX family)